ncbi:MAG: S-methyl-5'-thioadenosine phosphorylase [Chloroflexota bacterium]|nr:S-methyl-5'-thioadenosine phosphorylase [Chloroflexota bacterium]
MSRATIGIIGGSGLYDMPGLAEREDVALDTPFGAPSDQFVIGTLSGQRVAFLPRHGRGHRLLPTEVPSRANIHAFKQLGVERLISVSAVGSLREDLPPGRLVVPDQLLDRTKGVRPFTFFGAGVVGHVGFDPPFCPQTRTALCQAIAATGQQVVAGATLCVIEGPQFSTRAESEFHRRNGCDLVGMTALPEAKLAREAELCYATLALVTDYDVWHPQHDSVTVDAVVQVLQQNVANAQAVIAALVPLLTNQHQCRCGTALQHAIMTAPPHIPAETRTRLELIIGKYLDS